MKVCYTNSIRMQKLVWGSMDFRQGRPDTVIPQRILRSLVQGA